MDAEAFATSFTDKETVALFLSLYDAGKKQKLTELLTEVSNYTSLRKRIALFEEDGLVTISLVPKPRKNVMVGLTPKGRKVGSLLDQIRKILPPGDISNSSVNLKFAVPVIVMLYRFGPMQLNDFLQVYKSYNLLVKKLFPALEEDGIVRCWTKEDGYRSHMVELTGIGKDIGPLMNEVLDLIKKN